jgi:hypothetical protein
VGPAIQTSIGPPISGLRGSAWSPDRFSGGGGFSPRLCGGPFPPSLASVPCAPCA